MGNGQSDEAYLKEDCNNKELDLSQQLNHSDFRKHLEGQCDLSKSLSEIPANLLSTVTMYERLNVSCNCLSYLPPDLPLHMPHLCHLDLSYNHLSILPASIGLFVHLQTLLLKRNKLKSLPKTFHRLVNLRKLDLCHNVLTQLPEDLGHLPRIAKINVSHNRLRELPESLATSSTLRVLLATTNLCENPPQEVCDKGSAAILEFLRKKVRLSREEVTQDGNVFPRIRSNEAQSPNVNPTSSKLRYVKQQTQTSHTASRVKTPLIPPLGATTLSDVELGDRICGLVYGAVVGDSLGLATDLMSADECSFYYEADSLDYASIVQDEHTVRRNRGAWTSNTDQMLLMLDSILQWAGAVDELDFAKRLLHWKFQGFPELDEGGEYVLSETINTVLKQKKYRDDPHSCSRSLLQPPTINGSTNGLLSSDQHLQTSNNNYCDNGALPRAIILGVTNFHNLKEVCSNSARICIATHADPRCVAACTAISVAVALLLQGHCKGEDDESEIRKKLVKPARDLAVECLKEKDLIREWDDFLQVEDLESIQLDEKDFIFYTYKPVAAAFLSLRKSNKDLKSCLVDVIMKGGHSSMNGCIAGALVGCKLGFRQLNSELVTGLEPKKATWLNRKINSLLDKMGIP